MAQDVRFSVLFSHYAPPEALKPYLDELHITDVQLDARYRTAFCEGYCARYIPANALRKCENGIAGAYGLKTAELHIVYPAAELAHVEPQDLTHALTERYSPARAILAGCRWEPDAENHVLRLHLAGNGVKDLEPHIPALEHQLSEQFGEKITIEIHAGTQLEGQALFDRTEAIRAQAVKDAPKAAAPKTEKAAPQVDTGALYGKPFTGKPIPMKELNLDMGRVIIEGEVIAVNHKELKKRGAWVVNFDVTDHTGSVRINRFFEANEAKPIIDGIYGPNAKKKKPGIWIRILGKVNYNKFENDMVVEPIAIMEAKRPKRVDTAKEKRVELHLHTTMSSMDALTDTMTAVRTAAGWGHQAIAITDHGGAQSFPDAMHTVEWGCKVAGTDQPMKILYGCEGYYVNDVDDRIVVHGETNASLHDEFVAFDLETTGLSARQDVITEIGAVIMRDGEVLDRFQTFVDPGRPLEKKIVDLTGITDEMLRGAPKIGEILPKFLEFCGDRPLCAHNADFDVGFITAACERLNIPFAPTYVDTLILAQNLLPKLGKYKLNIVADALNGTAKHGSWLLKILFTAITIGCGFKGGEVVPSFFVGATFGCLAAGYLGLPAGFGAAIGLVAVFCGAVNCPIASVVLSVELFGATDMLYFAMACAVSYMLSGYCGLYSSQTILYSKLRAEFIAAAKKRDEAR